MRPIYGDLSGKQLLPRRPGNLRQEEIMWACWLWYDFCGFPKLVIEPEGGVILD